jgi:hypothetical protein
VQTEKRTQKRRAGLHKINTLIGKKNFKVSSQFIIKLPFQN